MAQEFTMDLNEIQKAVSALTPDDLARFRRWFETFEKAAVDERLLFRERVRKLRGSLKGTGALKALMEERRKERERER